MIHTDGRPTIAHRPVEAEDELTTEDMVWAVEYERLRKLGLNPVEAARAAGMM